MAGKNLLWLSHYRIQHNGAASEKTSRCVACGIGQAVNHVKAHSHDYDYHNHDYTAGAI